MQVMRKFIGKSVTDEELTSILMKNITIIPNIYVKHCITAYQKKHKF